jgi:F-type H+-transporting ATPase subunit delta
MKSEVVAERYARALLNVANDRGQAEAVLAQVGMMTEAGVGGEMPLLPLRRILSNPKITPAQKDEVVGRLFPAENGGDLLGCLIGLMRRKGRTAYLEEVFRLYGQLLNKERGMTRGHLATAVALEPDLKNRLQEKLSACIGCGVDLTASVDPDLIGGFIFSTRTLLIDASIQGELAQLEVRLKQVPLN